jgi:ribosomal protein L31
LYKFSAKLRNGFKTLDWAQEQEAHLNQYSQMCHPAYAGTQTDEKAQSRLRRDEKYILKRFATQLLGLSPPEADKMGFCNHF